MTVQSPPSATTRGTAATALYCYGVAGAADMQPQQGAGLDGKAVERVAFGEVAALVSPAPPGKVRARRADLLTHFDVLAKAFEHGTVLPLRFGIVFDDE